MVARNLTARATARHEDKSDAFRVGGSQHTQQFANLYFSRLKALAPTTLARARATWGDDLPFVKTLDAEVGVAVGVVGTLFADLGGKPDIMKEVTRDILAERPAEAPGGLYGTGDGDTFCLEDESGRISLSGAGLAAAAFPFATGAVIAVRGKLDPDGTLVIDDVCLPGAPPAAPTSVLPEAVAEAEAALGGGRSARPPAAHAPADKYVALASGLQIGGSDMEPLPLVLLSEFLTGHVGSAADLALQASIVRLVLCGNSAADVATTRSGPAAVAAAAAAAAGSDPLKKLERTEQRSLADCMAALDAFLTSVCATMPVDLMPGPTDPCNYMLPQQPLHPCMLPQAARLSTLCLRTNPYACTVGGVPLLGTSGQPIDDIIKYEPKPSGAAGSRGAETGRRLSALRRTLELRHLAPTAPDTLGCYPFSMCDPFVLRESPSVYFAANQPAFGSQLCTAECGAPVRLISVPDFGRSHSIVLVNIRTLHAHEVAFGEGTTATELAPMDEE
mmetsp:Transcript_32904/g.106396  ORF Transcript_32904/g.106396 Transcript_32904/m.106396 type:complete len:504 (+) Transcript_32904:122-1633(+)